MALKHWRLFFGAGQNENLPELSFFYFYKIKFVQFIRISQERAGGGGGGGGGDPLSWARLYILIQKVFQENYISSYQAYGLVQNVLLLLLYRYLLI